MNKIEEINSLKKTIEIYIEGTKTGNIEKLKEVFYSDAIMSGYLFDNPMICGTTQPFYNDIEGKNASSEYNPQITNVDITNKVACATLIEMDLHGANFVNYFHLQKIKGEWKIVSKLFTSI